MELTPRTIHEKQFRESFRGYKQAEVDDFLDRVAEALDRVQRENEQLHERIRELDQQMAASREAEEMLKKTLVTAQHAAEEAIAKAKAKAAELISEAEERVRNSEAEAQDLISEAQERMRLSETEAQERIRTADAESRRKAEQSERDVADRTRRLDERIQQLKSFEGETKRRLRAFFEQQVAALDALAEPETPSSHPARPPQPQPQFGGTSPRLHASPAGPREEGGSPSGETAEFEAPSPEPEQRGDDDSPAPRSPFFNEG